MVSVAGWVLGFLISFGIAVLAFVWALVARIIIWAKSRRPDNNKADMKVFDIELAMWLAVFVGCVAGLVGLICFAP